ncbi:exosome non-catalytic core subunit rrp40 [Malassezia equina]|uniref:Ribosomal RNA-processing protein 40 n=1 Tax=Malassezia equina TaxID=1381935 RepID=A0AAF0EAQ7_9BASI|nr:exosome non-catalytic core subunit rrp40 [Malassezia equina]
MVVVLPGDEIRDAAPSMAQTKLGPGMLPTPSDNEQGAVSFTPIRAGALGHVEKAERSRAGPAPPVHAWYVDGLQRRYVPAAGDRVIGQVTNRGMESYTVTLFSAHSATLPVLAFEGATRRNRPNLEVGALVYARVVRAESWTEPEISCVDAVTGKAEGLGELKSAEPDTAMVWPVACSLAQSLLRPQHPLLKHVAAHFSFEAAVGVNGLVWIRTASPEHAVAMGRVLAAADDTLRAPSTRSPGEPVPSPHTLHKRVAVRGDLPSAEIARLVRLA